jgi:2-polyprenyl-3-methyl-5-hydroxy-6-metoxy-1,4-benzoquinol methylase
MRYPDHDTYATLYARYFKRPVADLFHGIDLKGKRLLDLCGGGGRLSTYAASMGAKVVYLEAETRMVPHFPKDMGIWVVNQTVEEALPNAIGFGQSWDVVACQQAVNYWLTATTARMVSKVIDTDGLFVFNTFNNMPSVPVVKQYHLADTGLDYVEVSQLVDGMVHHVQCATGMVPHTTVFRWITREEYLGLLTPYFACEERVDGPTSIWVCRKREN